MVVAESVLDAIRNGNWNYEPPTVDKIANLNTNTLSMPKFNVSVDHETPRPDAIAKLKNFSEQIRQDSPVELTDVTENWDTDGNLEFAFKAMGMTISGSVVTSDSQVVVAGKLPFAAVVIRGGGEALRPEAG